MTMRTNIGLLIVVPALLAGGGCGTTKTHQEHVNAAEQRWLGARSGLMLQMAQQQFDTGNLNQAQKSVGDALKLDPANDRLWVLNGRIALERGKLEVAYKMCDQAIKLNEKNAQAHYYQGVVLQRWEEHSAALIRYRRAYELQADNPAYLLAVAEMVVAMGQPEDALKVLEEKLLYFDQNAGIRLAVAQLHVLLGRPEQSIQYFHRASLLRPDDLQIREELALAQLAANRAGDAIRTFEELLRDPEMTGRDDLRMSLGNAYLSAKRYEAARETFIGLTRRDKQNVPAWQKLGEACWAMNDEIGALTASGYVIRLAPTQADGYLLAGLVFQSRGQSSDAIRMFEQAARFAPDLAEPEILRGIVLEQTGRAGDAAQAYAEAVRRDPSDPRAQQLLAGVTTGGED